jgi:LysR family transcriptional regulator, glycine cleavage system transcriptional activator
MAMIRDDLDAGRLVLLSPMTVLEEFGYFLVTQAQSDPAIAPAAQAFRLWALQSRDPAASTV